MSPLESNALFPENQHGFRALRSTMSALSIIQKEWIEGMNNKEIIGVLLWDLSAAFDTVNADLLCQKLKLYGFDANSVAWFKSYLTERKQRIKIGNVKSDLIDLESGVPQGGVLSTLVFIIFVADFKLWLKWAWAIVYADDTSTSITGKSIEDVMHKLEHDALNVLRFMASNQLVANPKKTNFMILNHGMEDLEATIGDEKVKQCTSAKLLGINIDSLKNSLTSALNSKIFLLKRLKTM